jgi:hypothetical protein
MNGKVTPLPGCGASTANPAESEIDLKQGEKA